MSTDIIRLTDGLCSNNTISYENIKIRNGEIMKKKILSGLICTFLCASLLLTGCGDKSDSVSKDDSKKTEDSTESHRHHRSKDKDKEQVTEETEASEVLFEEDTEDTDAQKDTKKPSKDTSSSASSASFSGDYVTLDNMQFAINGKVYTLGQTTLQELVDDGVPFDDDSLACVNNNVTKNSQSQGYKITLGEYWSAQVYVLNDTDDNKSAAELAINEIYLPLHDDETQDILTFAFPATVTEDELRANAGEPTDFSNYEDGDYVSHTLEYTQESTKYYGDSGYTFEFTNGALSYITIEYLP